MKSEFKNKNIALIVRNNCVFDSRVIRAAETLSSAGHSVSVLCVHKKGLPVFEKKNGVSYIRVKTRSIIEVLLTVPLFRMIAVLLKKHNDIEQVQSPVRKNFLKIIASFVIFIAEIVLQVIVKPIKMLYIFLRFILKNFLRIALKNIHLKSYQLSVQFTLLVRRYTKKIIPLVLKTVIRIFHQEFADFSFNRLVISKLRDLRPDFIQANELNTLEPSTYYKKKISPSTRVIYDSHELEAARDKVYTEEQKQKILEKERYFLQFVDKTITVSKGLAQMLNEWHGIDVDVIYSSPYVADKQASLKTSGKLRKVTGLDKKTPLAIYVGKLKIGRGHELIIEALSKVPDLHIAMMGVQPPRVLEHHSELAKEYGVAERIHFLSPCHHADVPFFISDADFGIIPTQNKGLSYQFAMPNKLFEMTFAGLPVIAGNLPNMVEYINANNLGVIMDESDPRAIAEAMKTILRKLPKFWMTDEAHLALLDEYDGSSQGQKLLNIYARLI